MRRNLQRRFGTLIALVVLAAIVGWLAGGRDATPVGVAIEELFQNRVSGATVESGGEVVRLLRDDLEGSRHQRFIVRLASGHTLLISHNIDLAPRIEHLGVGDRLVFRGQYEWNERGGVVHWTHHDPDGRRSGGWIEHDGHLYR